MKPIAVLVAVAALVAAGCTGTPAAFDKGGEGAPTGTEKRMIDVYAAIIRQLVTEDHTFGSGPSPFDRVYVLDGVATGSDATRWETAQPFSPAVRAGILEALRDLPPVEFVSDPDSVVIGEKRCAHVKGNGALITLGPISGGAEKVKVPSDLFFACLGGLWLTYVLEPADGGWQVVGTTGGIAIS